MRTRESKDQARREREAAWAAEDKRLNEEEAARVRAMPEIRPFAFTPKPKSVPGLECPACGSTALKSLAGKKVARTLIFAPALLGVVGKHWECVRCNTRF